MIYSRFTDQDLEQYNIEGFLIKKGFFSAEEVELLYGTSLEDDVLGKHSFDLNDQQGLKTKLALWFTPGEDVYGAYSTCSRIFRAVEKILGGAPAHFHSKLMQKEPKVGGAWEWHQDYGYWYKNGFLYPQMTSVMVALTKANRENGCLQVLKGSHLLGRIEHGFAGEQVGADQKIIDVCLDRGMELVYVELDPGDTLFFHCNLLHRSDANNSDQARWSLISAYNLATNKPFRVEAPVSSWTPISERPDDALLNTGHKGLDLKADFLEKEKDIGLK